MPPWNDLSRYPVETTRFHPTFAYEMLFNFLATGILIYLTRKYKEKIKPGVAFGVWLILAGVGRNIIEFFRPDQPTFPGTAFSYSRFVAILMVLAGVLLLLIKYRVLKIGFIPAGEDEYTIAPPLEQQLQGKKAQNNKLNNSSSDEDTQ
jgi:prolipoprotein diacylglyceryltransferase